MRRRRTGRTGGGLGGGEDWAACGDGCGGEGSGGDGGGSEGGGGNGGGGDGGGGLSGGSDGGGDGGGRAGANYGRLHAGGSTTTTRRLGRSGRAAPSRTGRAPYPARRRSHSDAKRGSTVGSPIYQLHSSSGAQPRATAEDEC